MIKLKKMDKKYIFYLIIIIVFQIISVIYATSNRENGFYHMDELYSHGLMQYKRAFIFENEDYKNNWHNSNYFKKYLTITQENKWDFGAVYRNQIDDVHPPFWYLLLRIACMFNLGDFSIWPGTILNIILSIFCTILLYCIGYEIFKEKKYALLLCLLNNFSLISIETVIFVRMYQLFNLNILILIYWHIKKMNIEEFQIKDLIPLGIMVLIGFLTHYYYAIFMIILYLVFIFYFFKRKQLSNFFKYTMTLIISVIVSIIIWPYSIKHIFFGYRGQQTFQNISSILTNRFATRLRLNFEIINKNVFNEKLFIITFFIIILCIFWCLKKYIKKDKEKFKINFSVLCIIISSVGYGFCIVLTSPYCDIRYIMPIYSLIFIAILYLFKNILEYLFDGKNIVIILTFFIIVFDLYTIPKLSDNIFTYKGFNHIVNSGMLGDRPLIYIYTDVNAETNATMFVYNILQKANETYILPENDVSVQKIIEILQYKEYPDGVIILVNANKVYECLNIFYATKLFDNVEIFGDYSINGFITLLCD